MKKYKIVISKNFKEEINSIYNYLNFFLNEPYIAKNTYNNIMKSIATLIYFPERYQIVKSTHNSNYRKLILKKFIILYTVSFENSSVQILHIYHGNQNYFNLL